MAKGTSGYLKPKKQVYKELDEAEVGTSKATTTKPAPPPLKQPKPKQWWER